MPKLAIIGGGDLGQQIAAIARAHGGYEVVGFFDDFQPRRHKHELADPSSVRSTTSKTQHGQGIFDALLVGIGYKHTDFRRECFQRFSPTITFPSLVHPAAHLEPTVTLGCRHDRRSRLCVRRRRECR